MKRLFVFLTLLLPSNVHAGSLSSETGRYVFGEIDSKSDRKYMLDTKTGKLWWEMYTDKEGAYVLVPVFYFHELAENDRLTVNPQDVFEQIKDKPQFDEKRLNELKK